MVVLKSFLSCPVVDTYDGLTPFFSSFIIRDLPRFGYIQKELESLDDASTELMMMNGDVLLMLGEAFLETPEDEATEYCEAAVERLQSKMDALTGEEEDILQQQQKLKVILYGRFGKSINLEDDEEDERSD